MPLPNQNIPESAKTTEWMKRCASAILRMSWTSRLNKARDKFCYDIYNGVQNEGDFDYLRKVDDYEYPAKIRFVPLLRPKFDRLRAEEPKRPFNWRVFTIDSDSVVDKNQKKFEKIVSVMAANKKAVGMQYQEALQQLEDIQMQIGAARQKAAEEMGQVPPELEQQLRSAEREINMGKYVISHENLITDKELEDIELHFKYKFKDFLEIIAEKSIKFIMATQNLRDLFNLGFEDKLVVDKEYYYCDWEETMNSEDPEVRKVNPMGFYYAGDSQVEWVGEAEWCMEERFMTVNQIIDEYGDKLSFSDLEKLKTRSSYINTHTGYGYGYHGDNYSANGNGEWGDNSVDGCGDGNYSGQHSEDYANTIRVCKMFWQSPTKMRAKKSPNPHQEGKFFTHMMGDDESIKEEKGEKEKVGYKNDVYQTVIIDTNIYVDMRKKKEVRSNDNFSRVELPYVGRAHNYYTRRPYSLVWAAKDVQILYNIIHYHKELWLALSGVKGFIMDKSQIPEGMSMKEWMYQRKMGVGWIQSVKSGLNRQPTFNQFQNFDDSMGPGIQYLLMMLQHLEGLASSITGVSPQRMGDIAPTDQVGTTEQSIQNSSLVTEIIFYDHEQVKRRVLNRIIKLCRGAWKKGKKGAYVLGDFAQELLNVPEGTLERADYMVFATDSGKEEKALNDLKAMAHNEQQKGMLTFSNLVKLYNTDNLRELEAKVEKYEELAMQRAQSNQEGERQHEAQMKQMDSELKIMLDKQSEDAKGMMAQLEQAKLEWEMQKFGMQQAFEEKKLNLENEVDHKKIDTEEGVEMAFLDQQKDEADKDFVMGKADLAMKGVEATQNQIKQNVQQKEKVKD
jgi:hypothetical protein